jgi:hypothetical protein
MKCEFCNGTGRGYISSFSTASAPCSICKGTGAGVDEGVAARSHEMMCKRVRHEAELMLTAHYGERCDTYDADCIICAKWELLDALLHAPYEEEQ